MDHLLKVLSAGVNFVLGSLEALTRPRQNHPSHHGQVIVVGHNEAWGWFRKPIPPAKVADVIFGHVRNAIGLPDTKFIADLPLSKVPDEDYFIRSQFAD